MSDKRILLISFYFRPDLSAGSFRMSALVDALLEKGNGSLGVDMITTLPNRYSSFNLDAPEKEPIGKFNIFRIRLPSHKSGMIDQAKAFFHFASSAYSIAKVGKYDLIFATSSRLMTAALGAWIARSMKVPLYLDIRDIFVDTIKDVLPKKAAVVMKPIFSLVEHLTISTARHVNVVSRGFGPYFKSRYPQIKLSYFTNGIDDGFLNIDICTKNPRGNRDGKIRVLYAGNIGEGQGLHTVIPQLAFRLGNNYEFRVIGDGGRKPMLEAVLAESGVQNVELLPPMQRDGLIEEYLSADVLFLHLNDYDAFKKVLPSKIFEYAAIGKPIWAGVAGYAAQFLSEEVSNVAVFPPCDIDQALKVFEGLELQDKARDSFVQKFERRKIMQLMAGNILSFIKPEAKV